MAERTVWIDAIVRSGRIYNGKINLKNLSGRAGVRKPQLSEWSRDDIAFIEEFLS
jgi:hypothetical protein